jgi:hypothetical protein
MEVTNLGLRTMVSFGISSFTTVLRERSGIKGREIILRCIDWVHSKFGRAGKKCVEEG